MKKKKKISGYQRVFAAVLCSFLTVLCLCRFQITGLGSESETEESFDSGCGCRSGLWKVFRFPVGETL